VFRSGLRKLVATALGVLLAGLPLAAVDLWLDRVIERQVDQDTTDNARRAAVVIETRLAAVAASLDRLASQGVASCGADDLETLRRASFLTSPVKEFSVIGPEGEILCSDLGLSLGTREVVAVPRPIDGDEVQVEVVRVGDGAADFVRVRRYGPGGGSLAALVPPDLLIPLTSNRGGPSGAVVQVFTRDGRLIGQRGTPPAPETDPDEIVSASMRVDRFGMVATVTRMRNAAETQDLRTAGLIVNLVVVFAVLALACLVLRRRGGDPLDEIRRALDGGEFVPYFQPIVDIISGKVLGAEVLARWRKPDGSVVLPSAFIPLAERGGLMTALTEALMRRACIEVGEAYARRPKLEMAFNLTAAHFADERIVGDLRAIFDRSPVRLAQVTLELTERDPIRDMTATRRVIAALQGLGCKVALDDVGTGHSGLSSILRLGVDVIKIDKMFIDSLGSERNSATIVDTMVELGRNMRMEVVAEGVENFEQVADLRARGIRAAQGYVFAPPLPASSFLTLLDALDPAAAQPAAKAGVRGERVA
jgi:sensor c-di-GMP phosphodiesterase-like protein